MPTPTKQYNDTPIVGIDTLSQQYYDALFRRSGMQEKYMLAHIESMHFQLSWQRALEKGIVTEEEADDAYSTLIVKHINLGIETAKEYVKQRALRAQQQS